MFARIFAFLNQTDKEDLSYAVSKFQEADAIFSGVVDIVLSQIFFYKPGSFYDMVIDGSERDFQPFGHFVVTDTINFTKRENKLSLWRQPFDGAVQQITIFAALERSFGITMKYLRTMPHFLSCFLVPGPFCQPVERAMFAHGKEVLFHIPDFFRSVPVFPDLQKYVLSDVFRDGMGPGNSVRIGENDRLILRVDVRKRDVVAF